MASPYEDSASGLERNDLDELAALLDGSWASLGTPGVLPAGTDLDAVARDLEDLGMSSCPSCDVWLFVESADGRGFCEDCQ